MLMILIEIGEKEYIILDTGNHISKDYHSLDLIDII